MAGYGSHFPAPLLPGAAAAAATLQPTPASAPRPSQAAAGGGTSFQPLPPAHLQQMQHQQQIEQQQRLAAQQAAAQQAQMPLQLPSHFCPGVLPLAVAGAQMPGAAPLPVFSLPGMASAAAQQHPQQQWPAVVYAAPPQAPAGALGLATGEADVLYVNPRQLAGILRRRKQREKEEEKRRRLGLKAAPAKKRTLPKDQPRRPNGKFMSKAEMELLEERQQELADRADARHLEREQQEQGEREIAEEAAAGADPQQQQQQHVQDEQAQEQQRQGDGARQQRASRASQQQPSGIPAPSTTGQAQQALQASHQASVGSPDAAQRLRQRKPVAQRADAG